MPKVFTKIFSIRFNNLPSGFGKTKNKCVNVDNKSDSITVTLPNKVSFLLDHLPTIARICCRISYAL